MAQRTDLPRDNSWLKRPATSHLSTLRDILSTREPQANEVDDLTKPFTRLSVGPPRTSGYDGSSASDSQPFSLESPTYFPITGTIDPSSSTEHPPKRRKSSRSLSAFHSALDIFNVRQNTQRTPRASFSTVLEEEDKPIKQTRLSWLRRHTSVSLRRTRPTLETPTRRPSVHDAFPLSQPSTLFPHGGAGARASAAASRLARSRSNAFRGSASALGKDESMENLYSDAESGIDMDSARVSLTREMSGTSETAISYRTREASRFALTGIDPCTRLPRELMCQVFSLLDVNSLMQADLVCQSWHKLANDNHVWKAMFAQEHVDAITRAKSVTNATGNTFGLGKLCSPVGSASQPWKETWKAKRRLDQRWCDGHAAAIYLEGHTDAVYCVHFDEDKIITGGRDRMVRVWDTRTWQCIKIVGKPAPITTQTNTASVPLSRRKVKGIQPFVSLARNELEPGQQTANVHPPTYSSPVIEEPAIHHTGSILCLQFDDHLMVTGSSDHTVLVWSMADLSLTVRAQLCTHHFGVLDVCLSEKYIVSCSKDTTISVHSRLSVPGTLGYDPNNPFPLIRKLHRHHGPVNAVQVRGDLIVSASGDGVAKLWNIESGLCIREFRSRDRGLACVEMSPDCRTILAGGNDRTIYRFDATSGVLVGEMRGHAELVRSLFYDSGNGRIVSGSYDHSVRVHDAETGEIVVSLTDWTTSWMLSAKSDFRRVVAASQDGRVVVVDFGFGLEGVGLL